MSILKLKSLTPQDLAYQPATIRLGTQEHQVTSYFWLYWYFAAARQELFFGRLFGQKLPEPDQILKNYRFTNPYRASDRVSQYLLTEVVYNRPWSVEDTIWRTLLFKIFNQPKTWQHLLSYFPKPTLKNFDLKAYQDCFDQLSLKGTIYNPAYIMPQPKGRWRQKHRNHLELLKKLKDEAFFSKLAASQNLQEIYQKLLAVESFGPFLAFQYSLDINYGPHFCFPEEELVVAGPGCLRGLRRCFEKPVKDPQAVLKEIAKTADNYFDLLGLNFKKLGQRPLMPGDCQNLFCELDKYARLWPTSKAFVKERPKQYYRPFEDSWRFGLPPAWKTDWSAQRPITIKKRS